MTWQKERQDKKQLCEHCGEAWIYPAENCWRCEEIAQEMEEAEAELMENEE